MKAIKTTLLLLAIFLFQQKAGAQNIATSTIAWSSASTFVAASGETQEEATILVTYSNHIEWKTAEGSIKYNLDILETNGAWTNIASPGSILFEVDDHGNRGTVMLQKSDGETIVRIVMVAEGDPRIYELKITNIELLP